MKRRDLLLAMGATGFAVSTPWLWRRAQQTLNRSAVGGRVWFAHSTHQRRAVMSQGALLTTPGFIARADVMTGQCELLEIPLFGHEISQSPVDYSILFTSEKWGRVAAAIDFKSRRVISKIVTPTGRRFFGHAVFAPDGNSVYCAEMNDLTERGVIARRDLATGHVISEFDSGGVHPHQLKWLDGGIRLACLNHARDFMPATPDLSLRKPAGLEAQAIYLGHKPYAGGSRLSVFKHEVQGGFKISETRDSLEPSLYHFAHHEKTDLVVATGNFEPSSEDIHAGRLVTRSTCEILSPVVIHPDPNGAPGAAACSLLHGRSLGFEPAFGSRHLGEALSVSVTPGGATAAISLPEAKALVLWNWETDHVLQVEHFGDSCRGVAFLGDDTLLVTAGVEMIVYLKGRKLWFEHKRFPAGTGSHLTLAT